MIDLGLGDPGVQEHLGRQLETIGHIGALHEQIGQHDPMSPTCEVWRLTSEVPDAPVNFALSTTAALAATRGALDQLALILDGSVPSSRIVLQSLLRVALVGAGRVVFTLGPEDHNRRTENVRIVLAQESRSMAQALTAFSKFEHHGLKPDDAYVTNHQQLDRALQQQTPRRGDGSVLLAMAKVIADALAVEKAADLGADVQFLAEQVAWTWHTYSGLSHAFAWPWLLPGTTADRTLPGDYIADLGIVVATAHIAFSKALQHLTE